MKSLLSVIQFKPRLVDLKADSLSFRQLFRSSQLHTESRR